MVLILGTLAIGATVGSSNNWFSLTENLPVILRWAALGGLATYTVLHRNNLTAWIFAALLIGLETGNDFPEFAKELDVVSGVFMKLIKTIIAPLIFGTLVVGVAGHSDLKQVGRMGLKALIYFEVVTTIALVVGLLAINISKAGVGQKSDIPPVVPDTLSMAQINAVVTPGKTLETRFYNEQGKVLNVNPAEKPKQDWKEIVLHTFPENIAKSVSEGQVLEVVVFSILFAIGLTMVKSPHKERMLHFAESLSEVMFKFTDIVMKLAPFAVGSAIAYTVANKGLGVIITLLHLVGTLYLALLVFVLLVFLPIMLFLKIDIRKFIKYVSEPAATAFATASSEAALPKAMENMEKFGVPRKVVSFVIPTGYSFNLDGTTLYLAMASIFVAQAAGIELTMGQQITMMLTLMLTSKGVAGVRGASLIILSSTVASFGLPYWPITIIMGVDAFMDMARTSVNLIGNCLASVVIAKWEGELNEEAPDTLA